MLLEILKEIQERGGSFYVPSPCSSEQALQKTTHLAIAAHPDDVEIMAQHGILSCIDSPADHFSAVICTDGAGSLRTGHYAGFTDEEMTAIRTEEQKKAAKIGSYAFLAALRFTSSEVKDSQNTSPVTLLAKLLFEVQPRVIYIHNPADKHDTHVACALRTLRALRLLSSEYRPDALYGCEVWRCLDWLNDEEKICLDVSGHVDLRKSLLKVYASQIQGGKQYGQAVFGRQQANATFLASHCADQMGACSYAIDLMPLLDGQSEELFLKEQIDHFADDVLDRIRRLR